MNVWIHIIDTFVLIIPYFFIINDIYKVLQYYWKWCRWTSYISDPQTAEIIIFKHLSLKFRPLRYHIILSIFNSVNFLNDDDPQICDFLINL